MADESTTSSVPVGEIDQGPSKFEQFLDKNQKLLILLVILATLAIIALVVVRGLKQQEEEAAGAALINAQGPEDYTAVIADHPDTAASGTAYLFQAQALWNEGKLDDAVETLRAYLANRPDHPARAIAQNRLGSYLLSQDDLEGAAAAFEAATAEDGAAAYNFYSYTSLGDIARAQGNIEQAKSYYEQAELNAPQGNLPTFATDTAALRQQLLTLDAPELVAPPAPEPVETPAETPDAGLPSAVTPPVVVPAIETPAEPAPTAEPEAQTDVPSPAAPSE